MIDREKVIQHFEDAIEASGNNNKWRFVRVDILEDAITLLKSQEPRVLTLKELKEGEAYYMDEKGSYNYDVLLISIEKDATEPFMIFNFNPVCEGVGLNIRDYGKDWRCWSSKPTDEQREAVKWDV